MGGFVKGDIVVLPFPFSDLSVNKKRPALVIARIKSHGDVLLCVITSRRTRDSDAVPVSRKDFTAGGLPRDSNVRPNRIFTADSSIILATAGHLSAEKTREVTAAIVRIVSA